MHFICMHDRYYYNKFCDVTIGCILATRFLTDVVQVLLESDLFIHYYSA